MLTTAAAALSALPFRLLLTLHSATVVMWMRPLARASYMQSYWITFVAAFGGGVLSSIVLGDPSTPPALFASNDVGVIFTAVWWAINYSPAAPLLVHVLSRPPVAAVARAALNALRAGLVASRVDSAVARFPGVIAAPLFIGTLAGAGGKLASDPMLAAVAGGGRGANNKVSEFASPSIALRSAFGGALAQYLLAHVLRVVTPAEAGEGMVVGGRLMASSESERANELCEWWQALCLHTPTKHTPTHLHPHSTPSHSLITHATGNSLVGTCWRAVEKQEGDERATVFDF